MLERFQGLAALTFGVLVAACDDSSTGGAGPAGPAPTTAAPPPTPTTPGTATPPTAPTPGEVIPDKRTVKIVNLSSAAPVTACFRKNGTSNPFTAFGFRELGIPQNAMSARLVFDYTEGGQVEVKLVAASAGCAGEALGTNVLPLTTQAENTHYDLVLSGGVQIAFEHLTPTEGKDSIFVQSLLSYPVFTPSGGAAIPLRKISGDPDLLEPDLVGTLTRADLAGYERPFKALSGGTLSLFATADGLLVCDERAASVDGLTPCPASLRAP